MHAESAPSRVGLDALAALGCAQEGLGRASAMEERPIVQQCNDATAEEAMQHALQLDGRQPLCLGLSAPLPDAQQRQPRLVSPV